MKLATFRPRNERESTIGVLVSNTLVDLPAYTGGRLPASMIAFLDRGEEGMAIAREAAARAADALKGGDTPHRGGKPCAYGLADVELLAPVPRPGKIIHAACNFTGHLSELTAWQAPEWKAHNWGTFHYDHPTGFLQAPSSVVGSGARVSVPVFTKQLDYEIEIAVIIGKLAKNVPVERALDHVAGFCVFNDLSARDIQAREHANKVVMLGKSFDGSCPLGPYLVTLDEVGDPNALAMKLTVNGELRQDSSTALMRAKPAELVSWWSLITLEPGDVLTGGSPPGVAAGMQNPKWLRPGDRVEATIERLGTLVTNIVE